MEPKLLLDVGNSRLKAAALENGVLRHLASIGHQELEDPDSTVQLFFDTFEPVEIIGSTVNEPLSTKIDGSLSRLGQPRVQWWKSDGKLFDLGLIAHDLLTPNTTGVDRILSAIAALERAKPRPTIVVDAGSCITINLVTADGVFRGGAILPGLSLLAQAIHSHTAALPLVRVTRVVPAIGRGTNDAIEAGIFWSAVGGIREIRQRVARMLKDSDPVVFVAGGDAELLVGELGGDAVLAPDLVLEGLAIVTRGVADPAPASEG